jgi:hypothetical protein
VSGVLAPGGFENKGIRLYSEPRNA